MSTSKKQTKKRWPAAISAVAVVAVVIVAAFILMPGNGTASADNTVMSAEVKTGSISSTVTGTGALAGEAAEDIMLPDGLVIDTALVESGDRVSEGDALAVINGQSITDKIAEVQSEIETLDSKIEGVKDDTEATTIKSSVSGRVKAVYIEEGESVVSRMMDTGALLLVSLDGNMAVDIDKGDLAAGDSVKVELSDGTKKTGTVDSINGTTCVVTVTDNGPELGERVTVTDSDGNTLGSGELYVHKPLTVVGTYGTAEEVHVSENDKVYSGTKLITLTDVAVSAEYRSYMSERDDLLETLQTLLRYAQDNVLTAPFSGTVGTLNMADGSTTGSSADGEMTVNGTGGDNTDYSSYFLFAQEDSFSVTLLSNETTLITSLSNIPLAAPAAGSAPQISVITDAYTGTVRWEPADSVFMPETQYKAVVTLAANPGYAFDGSARPELPSCEVSNIEVSAATANFTAAFPATGAAGVSSADSDITDGGSADAGSYPSGSYPSGSYSGGSYPSGSYSGYSSGGGYSADSTSSTSGTTASAASESAALTISPDGYVLLTVSVDELDILSVEVGQTASVTLDAIENEVFAGVISKINYEAGSSGGVTKYSVEIVIPRTDVMLVGMNASVTIIIDERSDILLIPMTALQEASGRVFVYTSKDETGNLSGEIDVQTGLSDGAYVQIVSGLKEGDTVYYAATVTAEGTSGFSFGGRPDFVDDIEAAQSGSEE